MACCNKFKLDTVDDANINFLTEISCLKNFKENFVYEKTKKFVDVFKSMSILNQYNVLNNKGKRKLQTKKNMPANYMDTKERTDEILNNTIMSLSTFFNNEPADQRGEFTFEKLYKYGIENYFNQGDCIDIFLTTCWKVNNHPPNVRFKQFVYLDTTFNKLLTKKKILKIPVMSLFFKNKKNQKEIGRADNAPDNFYEMSMCTKCCSREYFFCAECKNKFKKYSDSNRLMLSNTIDYSGEFGIFWFDSTKITLSN